MKSSKDLVNERLELFGISPKRSLGQNFLISDTVVEKIINAARSLNPSHICEIGPGLGTLTEYLIEIDKQLEVIELDTKFAEYWTSRGVKVTEADALKILWHRFLDKPETAIISNLPYQISSRLVVELSLTTAPIKGMVFMFQKEVAERITAKPKTEEFGLLSVIAQTFWDISIVTNAGMNDFYPAPQVGSRVLRFRPLPNKEEFRTQKYLNLVKQAFSQRRKRMLKNLESLLSKQLLTQTFEKMSLDSNIRAEELSADMFQSLYSSLHSDRT